MMSFTIAEGDERLSSIQFSERKLNTAIYPTTRHCPTALGVALIKNILGAQPYIEIGIDADELTAEMEKKS